MSTIYDVFSDIPIRSELNQSDEYRLDFSGFIEETRATLGRIEQRLTELERKLRLNG